jgi:hypothetical protein
MAMEASVEAFWRGGEGWEEGGPSGRLGWFATCILNIIYPPATVMVLHKSRAQRGGEGESRWASGAARLDRVGKGELNRAKRMNCRGRREVIARTKLGAIEALELVPEL